MSYPKEYTAEIAYGAILANNGYTGHKAEIAKIAVDGSIDYWRKHGYATSTKEPSERLLNRQCTRHVRQYVRDRVKPEGTYEFFFLPYIIGGVISGVVSWLVKWWLEDTYGAEQFAKPEQPAGRQAPNRTRKGK